ncbi:DUF6787 family protein [Olleya sp. R77988]|uniref:DUF6787 family protein n=1 Tax=Olleya sp. R77988 TaxID=3093875 RepID=UPI0037C6C3F3
MEKFKNSWQIQQNWQLLFPILGLFGLIYSSYRLANLFGVSNLFFVVALTLIITFILLQFVLFLFKKLESKWKVKYKWELIRIFIVFAITGSSSVIIGKPIIKWLGITKENLNIFIYWILYIIIGIIFYQILLVFLGWLFGQHRFFWEFEKKMLRRFGLGKFLN